MVLLSLVAGVAVLATAGAGGTAVGYKVFAIAPGHFVRLAGTGVYCKNLQGQLPDVRSFLCARFGASGHRQSRTYVAEINARGIAVGVPPKFSLLAQFPQEIPGWYPAVVNSIAGANITVLRPGQWARLGTTNVFCEAYVEKGTRRRGFDCGDWAGTYHVGGSASAVIDEQGVEIDHWDSSGHRFHRVVTYLNPMTGSARRVVFGQGCSGRIDVAAVAGGVVRYTIFTIQNDRGARLSGTDVHCDKHYLAGVRSFPSPDRRGAPGRSYGDAVCAVNEITHVPTVACGLVTSSAAATYVTNSCFGVVSRSELLLGRKLAGNRSQTIIHRWQP